ncbi:uncharacterized protein LOC133091790 [Eubalaena glacialis]|uniref:uncharacterized protein LOC133091790 n=1 Tax=Eubalaena glacialis TaxID=27606 RepID=UPI002A5A6A19|nr:uncharacterized protein LOC133091790 [Eubalaena glacialis]
MRRPGKPTGGRQAPGPPGGAPLTGSAHASAARFPSPSRSRVFPFLSRSPQAEAVIALLLGACVIGDPPPLGLRRPVLCAALSCGGVPGRRRRLPLPWAARLRDTRPPPAVQENRDRPGAPSPHRLLESRGGGAWSAEGAAEPGSVNFGSGRLWFSPWIRGARRRRERRVSCMRDPEAKKRTLSLLKSKSFCQRQEKIFGCTALVASYWRVGLGRPDVNPWLEEGSQRSVLKRKGTSESRNLFRSLIIHLRIFLSTVGKHDGVII